MEQQNINIMYILGFSLLLLLIVYITKSNDNKETFNGLHSTAFGYNVDTEYHPPNSGYSYFGYLTPEEGAVYHPPYWKILSRRAEYIVDDYTPAPQIDFNGTNDYTLDITLVGEKLAVDGIPHKQLQLDRNKLYYIRIYTPFVKTTITDGNNKVYLSGTESVSTSLSFDLFSPSTLYYYDEDNPSNGGVIYLNTIRIDYPFTV